MANEDSFLAKFQYPDVDVERKNIKNLNTRIKENDLKAVLAKLTLLMASVNFSSDAPYASQYIAYLKNIPINSRERAEFVLKKLAELSEKGSIQATRMLLYLYKHGETEIVKVYADSRLAGQYRNRLKQMETDKNKEIVDLLQKASTLGDVNSSQGLRRLYNGESLISYPVLSVRPDAEKAEKYQLWEKINGGDVNALLGLVSFYCRDDLFSRIGTDGKDYSDQFLQLKRLIGLLQCAGECDGLNQTLKGKIGESLVRVACSLPSLSLTGLFNKKLNRIGTAVQFKTPLSCS